MKAIISVIALCGMMATAMVFSYPANAATRIEICQKRLKESGVDINNVMVNGGFCYDINRCPKMNELLGISPADVAGYQQGAVWAMYPEAPMIDTTPVTTAAVKDAACNACTSGGKPLCVSQ